MSTAKAIVTVIGFLLVLSSAIYWGWRIFIDEPAKQAEVDAAWEEYEKANAEYQQTQQDLNNEVNKIIAQANSGQ